MLARVQKNASEAVLASLAEVSRVAASKAIGAGARERHRHRRSALTGFPIVGALLRVAAIRR